ncbi:hypothetical protein Tco_0891686 [Tanacetum coccineum]|uniref:Uncharacterized protein n=1 Tax=Tanacetum coccineum TaxID=301880 RepID=A0ABQ5C928_9ASTR
MGRRSSVSNDSVSSAQTEASSWLKQPTEGVGWSWVLPSRILVKPQHTSLYILILLQIGHRIVHIIRHRIIRCSISHLRHLPSIIDRFDRWTVPVDRWLISIWVILNNISYSSALLLDGNIIWRAEVGANALATHTRPQGTLIWWGCAD